MPERAPKFVRVKDILRKIPRKIGKSVSTQLRGAATLLDIGSTMGPKVEDYPFLNRTDADAIRSDWEKVGEDMKRVIPDNRDN